jgi:hypothetical protein
MIVKVAEISASGGLLTHWNCLRRVSASGCVGQCHQVIENIMRRVCVGCVEETPPLNPPARIRARKGRPLMGLLRELRATERT